MSQGVVGGVWQIGRNRMELSDNRKVSTSREGGGGGVNKLGRTSRGEGGRR